MRKWITDCIASIGQHLPKQTNFPPLGFIASLSAKLLGSLAALLFHIVIARQIGVEQVGVFFLALAIVSMTSVVAKLGVDNALMRFGAINAECANWHAIKSLYLQSVLIVTLSAGILSIFVWRSSSELSIMLFDETESLLAVKYAALAIVPISLLSVHGHLMQALRKGAIGQLYIQNAIPFLIALGLFSLQLPSNDGKDIVLGFALATWLSLAGAAVQLNLLIRRNTSSQVHVAQVGFWRTSFALYPSSIVSRLIIPWAPLVMLGLWASEESVGLFSAASRAAMVISFSVLPINVIAAPRMAALYVLGDTDKLEALSAYATGIVFLLAFPILLIYLLLPEWIMGLFGIGFRDASVLLIVLAFGQFANAILGASSNLLMMSGSNRTYGISNGVAAGLVLIGGVLLVPNYHAIGAAVATTTALFGVSITATYFAKEKFGFLAFPFRVVRSSRS